MRVFNLPTRGWVTLNLTISLMLRSFTNSFMIRWSTNSGLIRGSINFFMIRLIMKLFRLVRWFVLVFFKTSHRFLSKCKWVFVIFVHSLCILHLWLFMRFWSHWRFFMWFPLHRGTFMRLLDHRGLFMWFLSHWWFKCWMFYTLFVEDGLIIGFVLAMVIEFWYLWKIIFIFILIFIFIIRVMVNVALGWMV